jgi:hypothetical protein
VIRPLKDGRTCSGERTARHSSSDLALVASDIFRMVDNLKGVVANAKESVGREINRKDGRAALISDGISQRHVPDIASHNIAQQTHHWHT